MEFIIRRIEKKDDAFIEKVIRSCLIEFGADHEGTAWTDPDLSRFSEVYNREGCRYWVAQTQDGEIVGGVGIGRIEDAPGVCELQKMYCLPKARGTGAAHQLIRRALNYAGRYYDRCYLETLENMTAARKFYEKYGFVRIEEPVAITGHFSCDVRYIREL